MTGLPEYVPRGGALEILKAKDAECLYEGPAGSGKTRADLQKVYAWCSKYPNSRHLLLRKTRISMNESVLVTWERIVLPWNHPAKVGPHRSHRASYTFPNGSEVVLGGLDNPDRIMSTEFDTVVLFEAIEATEEDWEKVLTRIGRNKAMPYSQAIAETNPGAPGHWLNVRANKGLMRRVLSRHADNPSLTPEYLARLARLTGTHRARYYEGRWVGSEGLIFEFTPAQMVPMNIKRPRVIVGIDDGFTNPFAVVRLEVDSDGHAHVSAEFLRSYLSESQKVEAVGMLSAGAERIVIDPAAAGTRAALRRAGLYATEANNDVLAGIGRVQQRISQNRLTIDPSCKHLIQESQTYAWSDNRKKDVPIKENDHLCDALRYATMALDSGGGAMVVSAGHEPKQQPTLPSVVRPSINRPSVDDYFDSL